MVAGPAHDLQVDRRSVLKKAAAVGGLAWVSPVVLAQPAGASEELPNGCTIKCLPLGIGQGTARASAFCSGQGVRRNITIEFDLSAVQKFTCPCGGEPEVLLSECSVSTSLGGVGGTCSVGDGGQVTVVLDIGRGSTFTATLTLRESVRCLDREGDACTVTCTTTASVTVPVPNQGNCNGFPNTFLAPTVSTTCSLG